MNTPPQIIARGFKDEPSVLYAVELQPNQRYVNVCRDLPARPIIGWPIDHAYDYDIDDFSVVWEAYSTDNKPELERLYDELQKRPKQFVDVLKSQRAPQVSA